MEKHPYFDLLLHTDQELETLLGVPVLERVTLHEWPLSCVQRLCLPGEKTWIYKSEAGPTVEAEFYAHAHSPLLVQAQTIFRDHRYVCLLLQDLKIPSLEASELSEEEAVRIGRRLLADIAAMEGHPPVYLDVSEWNHWQAVMDAMLQDLDGLVVSGKYENTRRDAVRAIARAASSPEVHAIFHAGESFAPRLVHHDLSAENVFSTPDGFRVIDWQRPIFGPPEIDMVLLLTSLGFDPRAHVEPGISTITDLLRVHWFTECTLCWFPPGYQTYDRTIAHLAEQF